MSRPCAFLANRSRSARLLALLLASTAGTTLVAAELKFEKPADLEKNFAKPTQGGLSVVNEERGVLRFSSGAATRLTRTAFAPNGKPADLVDEKIVTMFRFNQPNASFGIMSRVQQEESDCYVALVNIGPNGGILRLFKGLPRGTYADGELVMKRSPAVRPGEWYRLETSTKNRRSGVVMQAELKPARGGHPLMSVEWEDKTRPINNAGHVQLRFFSSDARCEIDVKEVSIKPDPKP